MLCYSMFKNLLNLLKTHVVQGKITTNGNCFFHALEYAIGNCDIDPNRQDLYQKTRKEVASFAIQKLKRQERGLLAEYKQVKRTDEEIARFYKTSEKRINFLEEFKTNKEYSNEDIIYYAALRKKKILCIVEEEAPNRVSMICPNIPFLKENIVFLVHSNGNHYNTFHYPIHVSEEMVYALKHLPVESVSKEYIITIKDFTLEQLLSFLVTYRVNRRKSKNIRTHRNLSSSKSLAKSKLLNKTKPKPKTLKQRKEINHDYRTAKEMDETKTNKNTKTKTKTNISL